MPFPKDPSEYLNNVDVFGPGAWQQYKESQSPQEMQRAQSYLNNVAPDMEPHGAGAYFPPAGAPEMSAPPEYLDESWIQMMNRGVGKPAAEVDEMQRNWQDYQRRMKEQESDEMTRTQKFMDLVSYVPDLFEGPGMMAGSMLLGSPAQRTAGKEVLKAFKKAKLPGEAGRGKFVKDLLDELKLGAVFGGKPRASGSKATYTQDLPISDILETPTSRLSKDVTTMEKAAYKHAYPDLEAATLFEREAAETAAEIAQREKHIPRLMRHREKQFKRQEDWGIDLKFREARTPEIATRPDAGPGSVAHEITHSGDLEIFAGGSRLPHNPKLSEAMQKRGWLKEYSDRPYEQLARLVQDIMEGKELGIQKSLSTEELTKIGTEMGLDLNKLRGSLK